QLAPRSTSGSDFGRAVLEARFRCHSRGQRWCWVAPRERNRTMSRVEIQGFRLSPQQEHLWHLLKAGSGEGSWGYGSALVEGSLDSRLLEAAVGDVVRQHEIFRTTFHPLPGIAAPLQVILEDGVIEIPRIDLSGLPEPLAELELLHGRIAPQRDVTDRGLPLKLCRIFLSP